MSELLDKKEKIKKLIEDYFVITTNVDDQFFKVGFDKDKIFAVQGSYRYIQCSKACHNKLYDATDMVNKMINNLDDDLRVPSELVPVCHRCGEKMEVNLRKDEYFVQDKRWYEQNDRYEEFLRNAQNKKVVLLEFGIGFNTPGIIRFPFEKLTAINENWTLVRFNKDYLQTFTDIEDKYIPVDEDIEEIIN